MGEGSGEGGKMQKFTPMEPPNRRGFAAEKSMAQVSLFG